MMEEVHKLNESECHNHPQNPLKDITNGLCLHSFLFAQSDCHCVCNGTKTAQLNGQTGTLKSWC
jgi:hypothetical protein